MRNDILHIPNTALATQTETRFPNIFVWAASGTDEDDDGDDDDDDDDDDLDAMRMGMGMGMRMGMGMGMRMRMIDEMINSVVWGVKTLLQARTYLSDGKH